MKLARFVVLLLISTAVVAWPVYADTVTIGLSTGGPITTVASGSGAATVTQPFDNFSNVHVSGQGVSTLTPPDLLFSDTIDTAATGGGTLNIFVTDSGLTSPTGALTFTSSFTSNTLPAGWTLTTATFLSATNALFTGTPLSSKTFSAIGVDTEMAPGATGSGPYSITEEYTIHATGAGDTNDTIDMGAPAVGVPEPSALIALVLGFVGIGFLGRRRVLSMR